MLMADRLQEAERHDRASFDDHELLREGSENEWDGVELKKIKSDLSSIDMPFSELAASHSQDHHLGNQHAVVLLRIAGGCGVPLAIGH